MRITEPFVKVSYALWVVDKGAKRVDVSVDGAELNPERVPEILVSRGYVREPLPGSKVDWTGRFSGPGAVEVTVSSRPGLDIQAFFPGGGLLVAECKGEPTPTAVKSGLDRTALYAAVGQLIISAGDLSPLPQHMVVVLPDTDRLRVLANKAAQNSYLRQIGLSFVLVGGSGRISEIHAR